ncbi:MAG: hypothetical protein HYV28_20430 [Ignavibacteriales bacterium]|nr:hypothetical protein [Ignavibacteriales bacterium]
MRTKSLANLRFMIVSMFLVLLLIVPSQINAQHQHDNMKMNNMKVMKKDTNSVVRTGVIDLKSIDKNKDSKVYQDQMHWNVISDTPGKCPLCKMILREVTLTEAQKNLKDNGFKVKKSTNKKHS